MLYNPNSSIFIKKLSFAFGTYGVEIFFVLSGFLIGKILINLFQKDDFKSHIKNFYIRRWFRTLPLYYLIFLINIIILISTHPNINISQLFYIKYLFFIQNFDLRHYDFFSQSWSLSIEEWFYLLMPVVLLVFHFKKIQSKNLYKNLIKIIFLIIAIRFGYVLQCNPGIDAGLRTYIPVRLDSILIGVVFACLKINNQEIYNKILSKKYIIINLILLVLTTLYLFYCFAYNNNPSIFGLLSFKIFFWSFLSFSFGAFIVFIENNEFINKKLTNFSLIKVFFEKTSLYSYSIYLLHVIILNYYFNHTNLFNNTKYLFLATLISLSTIYILSALTYKLIEKPIMDLRDKF